MDSKNTQYIQDFLGHFQTSYILIPVGLFVLYYYIFHESPSEEKSDDLNHPVAKPQTFKQPQDDEFRYGEDINECPKRSNPYHECTPNCLVK